MKSRESSRRGSDRRHQLPDRASAKLDLYSIFTPGLEELVVQELESLGASKIRIGWGGAEWRGGARELYRVNLWSRLQSRVLLRVATFPALHFSALEKRSREIPWELFRPTAAEFEIHASSAASKLYHTKGIEAAVREGIEKRLAEATTSPLDPATKLSIYVRIARDEATVSLDSSGELLHKRGWRLEPGLAPLRETLAAALLVRSGWSGDHPLIDPFTGVGTIPIEAARAREGMAPGMGRSFAFQSWSSFNRGLWASIPRRVAIAERPKPLIQGIDSDQGLVEAARHHARLAGVEEATRFEVGDAGELELPERPAWIVTDPPLGGRYDDRERALALGALEQLIQRASGWRIGVTSPEVPALRNVSWDAPLATRHGGAKIWLGSGEIR